MIKTFPKSCGIGIQEDNYDSSYAFVYILQLNKVHGSTNQVFIKTSEDEEVIFDNLLDGFYTLVTLKVPYDMSNMYYYKDGQFYKNIQEVELQEIIDTNPEVSGVEVSYQYYFSTCRLRKCYISICQEILDKVASIECDKKNLDKNLIYKRDLIWSALNVINYMAEAEQYEEAERLLERITGCNGLCDNSHGGCGCHKSIPTNCGCHEVSL